MNITQELQPTVACPKCKSGDVNVTPITKLLFYYQCGSCRHQWNESGLGAASGARHAVQAKVQMG